MQHWYDMCCVALETYHVLQVWSHIDDGSCPGQGIGVRTRLDNGLSGFILNKNISDSQVNTPEERVKVYIRIVHNYITKGTYMYCT